MEGKNLTYAELVTSASFGVYLIAINGDNVEVYSVIDSAVEMVQSLQVRLLLGAELFYDCLS